MTYFNDTDQTDFETNSRLCKYEHLCLSLTYLVDLEDLELDEV